MKKKTIVFRFFLFFVFFILLFLVVSEVLKDKRIVQEYDVSAKVKGFYEEKEDTWILYLWEAASFMRILHRRYYFRNME